MTSVSDSWGQEIVRDIIVANGEGGDTTHIIQYSNQFDGATAWKLCRGVKEFELMWATGAFEDPKLIWTKQTVM